MNLLEPPRSVLRNILVTGGVGFIGSHTVLCLVEHGYEVTILDNLDNSVEGAYRRMQELAGRNSSRMRFVKGDIRKLKDIDDLFCCTKFHAVVHFAGKKAVGQSVRLPMLYYTHNVVGTVNLIEAMRKHNVKTIVFSSSSTVYGNPSTVPITEDHPLKPLSPYGRSKLIVEDMFRDVAAAETGWRIMLLRYFNPIGAHPSGKLGEHPVGVPNNLVPWLQKVALGQCEALSVYGNDYPTRDGTCIRDYTHVMDIVHGHIAALEKLFCTPDIGCSPINLGRGNGTTVLELIKAFEEASGEKVAYKVKARRPGDSIAVWAATGKAECELGWKASHNLDDMCRDRWRWACANPEGYETCTAVAACAISTSAKIEDKGKSSL